jgi:hypothetical protein
MADTPSSRKEHLDALLLALPGVEARKVNRLDGYFVSDKMFACVSDKGIGLRVPAAMATELQFSREGIGPFAPGGIMSTREWIEVQRENPADHAKDLEIIQASIDFVRKGRR